MDKKRKVDSDYQEADGQTANVRPSGGERRYGPAGEVTLFLDDCGSVCGRKVFFAR